MRYIKIRNNSLKQVKEFSYLGSTLTEDGKSTKEVIKRLAQAKSTFMKFKTILTNPKLQTETRMRVLRTYIWSIVKYGCETWTICKNLEKRLNSFEMWCYRRMKRISWTRRMTNQEVLRKMGKELELLPSIKKLQMKFVGHVYREGGMEHLISSGMVEGKRARGRQRTTQWDVIKEWTGAKDRNEVSRVILDRKRWRTMIANAMRQGT